MDGRVARTLSGNRFKKGTALPTRRALSVPSFAARLRRRLGPMPLRLAALLLFAVSACSPDAPTQSERLEARATPLPPPRAPRAANRPPPARPSDDRPPVVFDTIEAPTAAPPTPTPPAPLEPLAPPTLPPSIPARPNAAGSCDVRPDESYCFAYHRHRVDACLSVGPLRSGTRRDLSPGTVPDGRPHRHLHVPPTVRPVARDRLHDVRPGRPRPRAPRLPGDV